MEQLEARERGAVQRGAEGYMGDNEELARIFGCDGPFWGRHYIFWHDQKPMTVVYEVFNPALERQLGPAKPGVQYL